MKDVGIEKVIETARLVLSGRAAAKDAIGEEAAKMLNLDIPAPTGAFSKSSFPITAFIGEALRHGVPETQPVLDVLAAVLSSLPWKYNYEPREDMPDLGMKMAWGEIIGPEAPYQCDSFCFGFTLIAPNSLYPAHYHPAIELYYVLSGTAEWMLEGKTALQKPGTFILHPANAVHAMRTGKEPLLAMYTWSGDDVVTLSEYVQRKP
ncbi:MAG: dimethylsulfonioproprionate lyase family protein [Oxalobacter sp.]